MSGAKAYIEKIVIHLQNNSVILFLYTYALHLAMYMYLIKRNCIPPKMINRIYSQMLYIYSNSEGHAIYDFLIMGTQFKALMEY